MDRCSAYNVISFPEYLWVRPQTPNVRPNRKKDDTWPLKAVRL